MSWQAIPSQRSWHRGLTPDTPVKIVDPGDVILPSVEVVITTECLNVSDQAKPMVLIDEATRQAEGTKRGLGLWLQNLL